MPPTEPLTGPVPIGPILLAHARQAIGEALGIAVPAAPDDARLTQKAASFVTLELEGELRGCIGSLTAHRSLGDDVRANAEAAALRDSRFAPLSVGEFARVRIEVSVLSEPEFLDFRDEADALAQLQPGRDGVIFFNGCQKATFLPQVWEQLPDRRSFIAALKQKARLPVDFWGPNVMLARYQVEKWAERDKGS